jgi:hypothetical protein
MTVGGPTYFSIAGVTSQGTTTTSISLLNAETPLGTSCTFSGLTVVGSPLQSGSGLDSITTTLMKNGVATAMTCSLTVSASVNTTCSDSTHTVAVSPTDVVAFRAADSTAPANQAYVYVSTGVQCH